MRIAAILGGGLLSLAASVVIAGSYPERYDDDRYGAQGAYEPAYEPSYRDDGYGDAGYEAGDRYGPPADAPALPGVWAEDEGGFYMYGHRGAPRACACGGGLALSSSFFDGYGGVGPIPDGGYYGGGYYMAYGGGSSRAFASASSRASASVSVRYRSHGGGHGHKGGGRRH